MTATGSAAAALAAGIDPGLNVSIVAAIHRRQAMTADFESPTPPRRPTAQGFADLDRRQPLHLVLAREGPMKPKVIDERPKHGTNFCNGLALGFSGFAIIRPLTTGEPMTEDTP